MKNLYHKITGTLLLPAIGLCSLQATSPDNDPMLVSIQKEIDRNMQGLKIERMASPFFIDYRLNDLNNLNIKATRGELVYSRDGFYRNGVSSVLVGDYQNNNENAILSFNQLYNNNYPSNMVEGTDDAVIRTCIWGVLDQKYKNAAEQYGNKISVLNQMEIPEEERNIPDFQKMEATERIFPIVPVKYDQKKLEEYIKKASRVFNDYKELNESFVRLYAGCSSVRYCNSEGTVCRYPNNLIALFIYTRAQSADGQEITHQLCLPYSSFEELPDQASLDSFCKKQADQMQQKLVATMIKEPYVGPVLFEGEAVANILNRFMVDADNGILAKRKPIVSSEISRYYSGHPAISGNELESMMNKKVISRDLSLTSLTGTPEYNNKKLFGYYEVDAQGVTPDKELVLIQDGVLKNMLTTRTPTRLFRESNGHARTSINGQTVTVLPGVLRLSSKQTVSADDLKKKLIAAAKEEDYDYAYIVRQIENDTPLELYRIQVKDGSEELVRGATVKNMTLRSFKRIVGVSDKENVYDWMRNDIKSSYIVPSGIIFEDIDIVKDTKLVLKKSYIVEKP